jgi:hypothetical protein
MVCSSGPEQVGLVDEGPTYKVLIKDLRLMLGGEEVEEDKVVRTPTAGWRWIHGVFQVVWGLIAQNYKYWHQLRVTTPCCVFFSNQVLLRFFEDMEMCV